MAPPSLPGLSTQTDCYLSQLIHRRHAQVGWCFFISNIYLSYHINYQTYTKQQPSLISSLKAAFPFFLKECLSCYVDLATRLIVTSSSQLASFLLLTSTWQHQSKVTSMWAVGVTYKGSAGHMWHSGFFIPNWIMFEDVRYSCELVQKTCHLSAISQKLSYQTCCNVNKRKENCF